MSRGSPFRQNFLNTRDIYARQNRTELNKHSAAVVSYELVKTLLRLATYSASQDSRQSAAYGSVGECWATAAHVVRGSRVPYTNH